MGIRRSVARGYGNRALPRDDDLPPSGVPARVAAVVLTHDRRELLEACLRAVEAQTHRVAIVHVVDNASSDGTSDGLRASGWTERPGHRLHRLERNAGGAGGFSYGVSVAREDADWLWLMDDDAEPAADCLAAMLSSPAALDPQTVALCPRVVDTAGRVEPLHRGFLRGRPRPLAAAAYEEAVVDVGYATFVGLLIRGDAARALDPPRAEFFLWADDYEYSIRLRERGAIRLVPAAAIVHKDVAAAATTRRGRLVNRLLGWEHGSTSWESAWRNFYGLRNYVWMRRRYDAQGPLGAAATVAQFALKALLYDERPLRRLPWLVRFARDGRRGVFRNPPPEWWERRLKKRR